MMIELVKCFSEEQARLIGMKPIAKHHIKEMIKIAKQIEVPRIEFNKDGMFTNKMLINNQCKLGNRLRIYLEMFVDLPGSYWKTI